MNDGRVIAAEGAASDEPVNLRPGENSAYSQQLEPFDGQLNLAAMLDKLASEIARGAFGDVTGCSVVLQGTKSNAIVTLPIEDEGVTAAKFRRAAEWCETGVLSPEA
jgi:hypothetical protein